MAQVIVSKRAIRDIESIRAFIAEGDSERYADRQVQRIYGSLDQLQHHPFSGRMVPELELQDIRELIVGSYRVIHRVWKQERIEVSRYSIRRGGSLFVCSRGRRINTGTEHSSCHAP